MPSAICFVGYQMVAEGTFPPQTGLGSLSPGAPFTDVTNIWGGPLALSTEKAVSLPELHISGSPVDKRFAPLLPFVTLLALRSVQELSHFGQGDTWSSEAHSAANRQGRGKPAPTSGQGNRWALGLGSWLLRWWRWGLDQRHISWSPRGAGSRPTGPATALLGPHDLGHSLLYASLVLLAQGPAGLETSSGRLRLRGRGLKAGDGGNMDCFSRGGSPLRDKMGLLDGLPHL